jgi:hypothetical protein
MTNRPAILRLASGFLCVLLLVVLSRTATHGQALTVQINGTVTDQSGSAVPGVEVTAEQTDTGARRTVVTDETGSYLLTQLPLGPYRLEAKKEGFRNYVQTGIVLQVNTNPTIPIALAVGQVTETVEVAANATLVETRSMGVGSVVENQRILELPLNGRNAVELITLAGAAVVAGSSPSWAMKTGVNISVAGGQTFGVTYLLDGAQHSNFYDATGMPLPFPDALQEFKVETSSLTAQYGTHSGAAVSGVTKSGTNAFHGNLFEFVRNYKFNGRNAFAAQRDTLKRNQFGGTVGGRIIKDKLFFFAGYQGTRIRQRTSDNTAFVPTAATLAGDFTGFASAQCQGTNRTLGGGFVGNQINPALYSPAALKLAARLPKPDNPNDPCGRVLFGLRGVENQNQSIGRIDYTINDKHTLFGRYLATPIYTAIPYDLSGGNILTTNTPAGSPVQSYGQDDLATSFTIGETWLINASTVNSFRAAFNRVAGNHPGPQFLGPSDIGVNAFSYLPKYLNTTVNGGFSIGQTTGSDLYIFSTQYQLNDDISLVRGSHQYGFGISGALTTTYGLANVFSIGTYPFTGQATGLGMADFLLGRVTGSQQAAPNGLVHYQRFFSLYAQDTWKATSRLTFNYGLRWDPFFPMQLKYNTIFNFRVDRFNQNLKSTVIPNAPAGFTYPGDPGFNGQAGIRNQWKNVAPRFGFAWDPKGDGRTSIRGGFAIAYDFVNQMLHHNTTTANPYGGRIVRPQTISFDDPWAGFAGGNPFPYVSGPGNYLFTPFGAFQPVPEDLRTPRVYLWNFSIQRQITPAWFVSASYVGNNAIHLLTSTELNPAVLVPNTAGTPIGTCPPGVTAGCNAVSNTNQRRILYLQDPAKAANIGFVTQYDDGATSQYHGMLLNTTWRPNSRVNINANYTWSHCIGDYIHGNNVPNPGANNFHYFNRALDRGNCGTSGFQGTSADRRHIFNITGVAETPRFSNRVTRAIASNWTTSVIYRYQTGSYLTISSGVDNSLTGLSTANQRVDLINPSGVMAADAGSACAGRAPCMTWLNPTAFRQPALGTFGNIGISNVLGPAFWQFDVALSRQFQITEGHRVEIRGEAFNILNSVRPLNPATNFAASGTFGVILGAYDPRIMQFAIKYAF